jgi:hypothetical protein
VTIPECIRLVEGLNPEWLSGIGELITGLAVLGFGIYGLKQYKEGQQLDAAEILLKMEKEFRCISAICSEIEIESVYKKEIQPLLQKLISTDYASLNLTDDEFTLIKKLDRALRFFYVCTIMHRELHVDEGVLGRAYYYWLGILISRSELYTYIKRDYKRLAGWLHDNQAALKI